MDNKDDESKKMQENIDRISELIKVIDPNSEVFKKTAEQLGKNKSLVKEKK